MSRRVALVAVAKAKTAMRSTSLPDEHGLECPRRVSDRRTRTRTWGIRRGLRYGKRICMLLADEGLVHPVALQPVRRRAKIT